MVRTGLKYLVPLCALVLTALLVLAGYQEERDRQKAGWGPPSSWDGAPPRATDIAVALNVPALLAATLVAAPGVLVVRFTTHNLDRDPLPPWAEVLMGLYLSIFVLAQWILIGRWLGKHQKFRSTTAARPIGSKVFMHVFGIFASLVFVSFGITLMKESGYMSTWIPGAGITAWSLIAVTILSLRLHRVLASR